jgi:hypothetical protein
VSLTILAVITSVLKGTVTMGIVLLDEMETWNDRTVLRVRGACQEARTSLHFQKTVERRKILLSCSVLKFRSHIIHEILFKFLSGDHENYLLGYDAG